MDSFFSLAYILASKMNVEYFLDSFMKQKLCDMVKAHFPIPMNTNS
jgi:hypothetical protein